MNVTKVSKTEKIGLGTWPFGGQFWSHGWGPQEIDISKAVILECLKAGINFIDTAPPYGLGQAEKLVGDIIESWEGVRPVLSTKCGQQQTEDGRSFRVNLSKEFIRQSVLESLQRLKVSYVDIVFLHDPSEKDSENLSALEELTSLVQIGKVKNIGLSNFSHAQILVAAGNFQIHAVQNKYSLLEQRIDKETVDYCNSNGIKVIGYQPLDAGLLSGSFFKPSGRRLPESDWRSRHPLFQKDSLESAKDLLCVLKEIATRFGVVEAAVAIAWVLSRPDCDQILIGIRNKTQLNQILEFDKVNFHESELNDIDYLVQRLKHKINP